MAYSLLKLPAFFFLDVFKVLFPLQRPIQHRELSAYKYFDVMIN